MAAVWWDLIVAVEQTQTGRREKDETLTLHMTPISHGRLGANLGVLSTFASRAVHGRLPVSNSLSGGERPVDHPSHLLSLAGNDKYPKRL